MAVLSRVHSMVGVDLPDPATTLIGRGGNEGGRVDHLLKTD